MKRFYQIGAITVLCVGFGITFRSNPAMASIVTGAITFDDAREQEKGQVDWYNWYLEARSYIASHGGLACPLGTAIVFSKSGEMRALSDDYDCQVSVSFKHFPLPETSQLPAVILPVRSHRLPPADPQELNQFVGSSR